MLYGVKRGSFFLTYGLVYQQYSGDRSCSIVLKSPQ